MLARRRPNSMARLPLGREPKALVRMTRAHTRVNIICDTFVCLCVCVLGLRLGLRLRLEKRLERVEERYNIHYYIIFIISYVVLLLYI